MENIMNHQARDTNGRFIKKNITNEQEIVEYYLSGDYFLKEVADTCNCTIGDVRLALEKHGIPIKDRNVKRKLPTASDEEIIEYYKTHNIKIVAKHFNTTSRWVKEVLARNNVPLRTKQESTALAQEHSRETKEKLYGDPNYTNVVQTSITRKNKTLEEKEAIANKVKKTWQEKYGDENYGRRKGRDTLIKKYGPGMFLATDEFAQKTKEHALKNFSLVEEYNTWVRSLAQIALIDKYGKPCGYCSPYAKEKSNSEEAILKIINTKKANNSFIKSKPEDEYYQFLIDLFGEEDIDRQHYEKDRYPFRCDFYVKSLDLFIECNYFWSHGLIPYDQNNEECIKLVEKWKERSQPGNLYERSIYIYTDLDVRKKQTALDNKLNYMMIYLNDVYYIKNGEVINDEHVFGF